MEDYDIVGSYDNQRVSTISAQRTINMFEYNDPEGKKPKTLLPTSGLVNANLDFGAEDGGARAAFVFKDASHTSMYQVFGDTVFKTTIIGGVELTIDIGTITDVPGGYVGIDANNAGQILFVDGTAGWVYDTNANTFKQVTDTGFPVNPIDVCAIDGFLIVASGGTNTFGMSSLNQAMVWSGGASTALVFTVDHLTNLISLVGNGFNFATGVPVTVATTGTLPPELVAGTTYYVILTTSASTNPAIIQLATTYSNAINNIPIILSGDGTATMTITNSGQLQEGAITSHPGTIVGCNTLHRRIFFFSQNYTEVWENAGEGTNLPIRRNNSLLMEVGTPSVGSIATGFDRMFFLSQDKDGLGSVMEVRGTEAIPVSNRALDYQLAQYASDPDEGVADARGVMIKENGIIFYRLNFTAANHTFVLNVTLSTVEKPLWHEEEVLNGDRHPAQTHAYFNGNNYYGAYDSATSYIVDNTVSTNDGEAIRRARIGREITPPGYNRLRIDRFHLDVLQGAPDEVALVDSDLLAETGADILTEDSDTLLLTQRSGGTFITPTVFLRISKDGGQSYGYELLAPMGAIGQRTFRTVWRKLGTTPRGQGFVPYIQFFNDVPFVILGAAWAFEVLPE